MAVSTRTFGVEIECTYGEQPSKVSDVYQRMHMGDRNEMLARARKEIRAHPDFKKWANNIGIDGSGIEIRSPILKGQEGIDELAGFFDFLIEKGSTVTNQDGMHVHHGAKDFSADWKALYSACATWGFWTPQIHKMVASRRRNGEMCRDAFNNPRVLERLEQICLHDSDERQKEYKQYQAALNRYYNGRGAWPGYRNLVANPAQIGGRGAFNLGNLGGKGTIEIRLAEGMMDRDSAVAWVKFGQAFLETCTTAKGKVITGKPKTIDTLLDIVGVDDEAKKALKAKVANKGKALVNAAPGKVADGVSYNEEDDE